MSQEPRYVVVGRIAGVFGVRGWVKVQSHTEPRERILEYRPWQLRGPDGWVAMEISNGQAHGKGVVAQLAGCLDPDTARALVGREVAVLRSQLPPLEDGEYYWTDLVGLRVQTLAGADLGVVDHLMETGSNDVLVVQGERERLIPYLPDQVVREVDLAGGRLVVDWDPED